MSQFKASVENIKNDRENLSKFNSTPGNGITRVLFYKEELEGREFIKKRMEENGLEVREDAVGNVFGRLPGTDPSLAPVWTGSHIDTVLNAGMFDGNAGVISGMEALRLIKESGKQNKRDIEVIIYTSEEPTRFGLGCLGSRTMAGELTAEEMKTIVDKDGMSLAQVLESLGKNLEEIKDVKRKSGDVHAAVELHVEQGAVLDTRGIEIGVVTTISAPTDIRVSVFGTQEHAGATPMDMRKDAMSAAAEIMLGLEGLARNSKDYSTVATVGKVEVLPGSTNVIPGQVNFSIDIRSADMEDKEMLISKLKAIVSCVENVRNVKVNLEIVTHDAPADADPHVIETIRGICDEDVVNYNMMVSGAYHDSMFVSKFAPFGMIFVPSKNGISHHIDEWTDFEDIAAGTDILAETLFRLSNE